MKRGYFIVRALARTCHFIPQTEYYSCEFIIKHGHISLPNDSTLQCLKTKLVHIIRKRQF